MEIIFHGQHNRQEACESLLGIIQLLQERYQIEQFREMHLSITLVDQAGADVELVDTETDMAYRTLEVYRQERELKHGKGRPVLKLVIDNS